MPSSPEAIRLEEEARSVRLAERRAIANAQLEAQRRLLAEINTQYRRKLLLDSQAARARLYELEQPAKKQPRPQLVKKKKASA